MKKKLIDEPIVVQVIDTLECPWTKDAFLKLKLGSDKLAGGHGEFGTITNPIPVNHVQGEVFYLNRLRTKEGKPVSYRRKGSVSSPILETKIDEFEVSVTDCPTKSVLHFDMYNFTRSTVSPKGFTLKPVSDFTDEEIESMKIVNPEMYT